MASYTKRGTIKVASDVSMTVVLSNPDSQFRPALIALLEQVAAGVIANDPTIVQAAVNAVADALAEADVIVGSNERSMKYGVPYAWGVKDTDGRVAFGVRQDGVAAAADFEARRARLARMSVVESADGGFAITDGAGKVAFRVDPAGRTLIGDLHPDSRIGGGVVGGASVSRVTLLCEIGQSNAAGRAVPFGPRLDPSHPRILMSQWSGTTVTGLGVATVPISSQQMIATAGLDPATVIARRIVAEQDDVAVVICNAARGGSGLVFDTPNGVWKVDYSGSNTHLFPIATAALTKTLADIAIRFPGVPVDVQFVWHQGESDGSIPYAEYLPALLQLIAAFRAHVGDATAPFVMGGTVPEDSSPAEEANIMAAQIQAQADAQYTAFAPGVSNGGGSSAPSGDTVHYNRGGMERLGERMHQALRRAYVNQASSVPVPPLDVAASWSKTAGVLTVRWSFPFCRVTSFVVEYSVDGGAWQTVTGRTRELDPVAQVTGLTAGDTIRARVRTVNETGTSAVAYSQPVDAFTGRIN